MLVNMVWFIIGIMVGMVLVMTVTMLIIDREERTENEQKTSDRNFENGK